LHSGHARVIKPFGELARYAAQTRLRSEDSAWGREDDDVREIPWFLRCWISRLALPSVACVILAGCIIAPWDWGHVQFLAEHRKCFDAHGGGYDVSEPATITIPNDEGSIDTFESATWRTHWESQGYPEVERPAETIAGTFIITTQSVIFRPTSGTAGLRIPYPALLESTLRRSSAGEPRAVILKSCGGRFDEFAFSDPQHPGKPNAAAASKAATLLKSRI
jgi:hypothetical protein